MLKVLRRLREMGVVGMNARNGDYIARYNSRRCYPLVDDKLRTKKLATDAGIAVPELYGVIEIEHQIGRLAKLLEPHQEFVIKPAHGSGGNGIVVITGRTNGRYRRANGALVQLDDLAHHISNILSGMHSLGGQPDQAIIEQRVVFDPLFEPLTYRGVPDIRTVVFQGVPVMAMVRLPTLQSDGKANLHQGAVGVGVDIASGQTIRGVWMEEVVAEHPDTGHPVAGLEIPHWDELLTLAARCYDLAGLGYLGVDIVLDRHHGPLILELNARPGLSIQLANGFGLRPRLERVESLAVIPECAERRAQLACELFADPRRQRGGGDTQEQRSAATEGIAVGPRVHATA
ncbi:alpha-L-glutamate ligase-like protein [Alkalilimnicola ehrlichii]|uniref:Alpha-L-glutamate ligase-like protein n=1 Tax=Alkalilimnicola ehrlichii TaxID=351052 RepID=A0A3E0X0Y4_9GAMM|nr:alpha-L-glutamate ligase-like protein [Alkalilimnicola ehrlichii]RFA30503.1 alpha-L-glutamate ligase-like protein [Alkalilimnicola ehrlichii]RFA38053.1 alpha-L-glutamate ligase-like protein [Alkalilimnicola ehrlichii]